MKRRRQWRELIRFLRRTEYRALHLTLARAKRRARMALLFMIIQGCPAASAHRPRSIIRAMETRPCFIYRVEAINHALHLGIDDVVGNALDEWHRRHWLGRQLMRSGCYRRYYVRRHTRHVSASLWAYGGHLALKRWARLKRDYRRRRVAIKAIGVALLLVFFTTFGMIYLVARADMNPSEGDAFRDLLRDIGRTIFNVQG